MRACGSMQGSFVFGSHSSSLPGSNALDSRGTDAACIKSSKGSALESCSLQGLTGALSLHGTSNADVATHTQQSARPCLDASRDDIMAERLQQLTALSVQRAWRA